MADNNGLKSLSDIKQSLELLESSPSLRDLTDLVTPNYAAKWRVIAPLLGLSKSDIDIIEHDHGRSAINCCSEMWGKWLDTDTKATWREVLKAIDHKAVTEKEKGNNVNPEKIDLLKIVPFIQEKWSFIGTRLQISADKLDDIHRECIIQKIPAGSENTFCCIQMLSIWQNECKDVSADTLIKAISAPHVGLERKIPSIQVALKSFCSHTSKKTYEHLTNPPELNEQAYTNMKAKFCSELRKSGHTVIDACEYLKICRIDPQIIESVNDYPDLVISLETHDLLSNINLSWLKSIAQYFNCTKALEIMQKYEENQLIADKVKWCHHTSHPNGTFLVARVDKEPEYVTIKGSNDAKKAASGVANIEETDSTLEFSEVGSVIFYWRITTKDLELKIQTVDASVIKDCRDASIIQIGIMTNGRLNMMEINKVQVMEGIYRKIPETKDEIPEFKRRKLSDSHITNNNVTDVLRDYQGFLKKRYTNLPDISKQGWYDDSVKKQFVNVTLLKSLERDGNDVEEYGHNIKGEVVYGSRQYVYYDEIFQIDNSTHQLLLFEGNAGIGKTTFSYKVLKTWAEEKVLQQYLCIVLVELRELKPGTDFSFESLFGVKEQSVSSDICTEVLRMHGNRILIWLEGWDELNTEFMDNLVLKGLLFGSVLPQATVVVTTRPSATRTLKRFNFTHKFKLIGFKEEQIEKYVNRYCTKSDDTMAETFLANLKGVPDLLVLAEVPLYLAILVNLFKAKKKLPEKLTDICSELLMICLQHHKEKVLKDNQPITSFDDLPSDMKRIFYCMQKCAYEQFSSHSQRSFTEQQISLDFFNNSDVPDTFDGLGLFTVKNLSSNRGISKSYDFVYKPIQEMLAALHLTRLQSAILIKELSDTFSKNDFQKMWVYYAGLTNLKQVSIKEVLVLHKLTLQQQPSITLPAKSINDLIKAWEYCRSYYIDVTNNYSIEFLLMLILCCYEAKNSEACRDIANHLYTDKVCRFEIPPNHATPYLLLAVSYFISHSGKTWSLRCNTVIHRGIELLFKHIYNPTHYSTSPKAMNHLWVFCCIVTPPDIDAYCKAIKSQSSLHWIHLLPGSYLNNDSISKLCECFHLNSQVIKIEIDDCGISSNGLRSIADMLSINQNILYIALRKNKFTLDDVIKFLKHINDNQHLQYLLLDHHFCENSKVRALLEEMNVSRKYHSFNYQ